MNRFRKYRRAAASAAALLIVILDFRRAAAGAGAGIRICLEILIPSLFPFLVLTPMLCLPGKLLKPLEWLCGAPAGTGSMLLSCFLGGYPVGATLVKNAYTEGRLTRSEACRMLGYCNQAGPAFLFGMSPLLFSGPGTVWVLWGILLLSAIGTAMLLPGRTGRRVCSSSGLPELTLVQSVKNAVRSIAYLCGWVILFRMVQEFADPWLHLFVSERTASVFLGLLELSNGCMHLQSLPQEGLRFLLMTVFLNFGGLCVALQTLSAAEGLDCRMYFAGKLVQTCLAFLLAAVLQPFFFQERVPVPVWAWTVPVLLVPTLLLLLHDSKKEVAFPERLMYNRGTPA